MRNYRIRARKTLRSASATRFAPVRCSVTDELANSAASAVFFYAQALDERALIDGLTKALENMPLYAGRIRSEKGKLSIVPSADGIPLSVANVELTLPEAIDALYRASAPWILDEVRPRRANAPLFTVRICHLSDGATLLGVSTHHSVGDFQSFVSFMQAWSSAVEGFPLNAPVLVPDRAADLTARAPRRPGQEAGVKLLGWSEFARLVAYVAVEGRRSSLLSIYFSDLEVQRMREELSSAAGQSLSVHDVIFAHVVTVIRSFDGPPRERALAFSVNWRRYAGLEPELVGNIISMVGVSSPPTDDAAQLAKRIREAVKGFSADQIDYHANVEFMRSLNALDRLRCLPRALDPKAGVLFMTSLNRSSVYDVRFGGQAPVFFSLGGTAPIPWISSLIEGYEKSGQFFSAVLPAKLVERLRSEEAVRRFHRFRKENDPISDLARKVTAVL